MPFPLRRRTSRDNRAVVPLAAFSGAVAAAAALFWGMPGGRVIAQNAPPTAITDTERATLDSLEAAFSKIAETASPAAVYIRTDFTVSGRDDPADDLPLAPQPPRVLPRRATSSGSGAIVRPDGYILTNDHVVEDANGGRVMVYLSDGTSYPGTVSGDRTSDLAVVKIDAGRPLPFLRLADSSRVRVGQWVVAIGSPFGQRNSMTVGVVSALHRKGEIGGRKGRYYPNLIQTDASINPGNSGGPLLNTRGELIGLNNSIYSPTGSSVGIGYAIPANTAKPVLEQLIAQGKVRRGFLGVEPKDLLPGLRTALGVDAGARLRSVTPDGPADRAGLEAGDVVTRIGDHVIDGEISLRDAISASPPGSNVSVTFVHEGRTRTATVTVGGPPAEADDEGGGNPQQTEGKAVAAPAARRTLSERLSVRVETLTDRRRSELAELFSGATTGGVLLARVVPGEVADDADLLPGDLVTGINGTPVATSIEFDRAASSARPGEIVVLTVLRPRPSGGRPLKMAVDIALPVDIAVP